MTVAIVILNFNGKDLLEQFLPSVIAHCPDYAQIYVTDNGSDDGSISFLQSTYPTEVVPILLDKNYGFAEGYNKALAQINEPYAALLNSDVEVTKGWLDGLLSKLESDETAAAVQPKIRDFKKREYFEYAGASGGFIDKYGFPFCRGRLFTHCERDIGQHNSLREVFWTTGACMLVRMHCFREVGGFDPNLFAHMEEIDLCWRMKNRGYSLYCVPDSKVYHLGGATLSSQSAKKTYLNFRNNLTIILKNDYQPALLRRIFLRMFMDGQAAILFLFAKGPSHFFAVLAAHVYFYFHLPKHLKKRANLRREAQSSNNSGLYKASIAQAFYIKKQKVFGALPTRLFLRQNRKK